MLRLPSQGSFIAAGSTFDAFVAVGKALSEAKTNVLMVDPYADEKALTDYALLAPDGTLHDRLILVDGKTAWALGQSFNKLAERAHTSLVRMPLEAGSEKIAPYEAIWMTAAKLS
jgi:hypothetical protein